MKSCTILVTGGCGFIGSNLAIQIKQKYPQYTLIALDNLKRRGSELNILRLKDLDIKFVHGDIRNKEDLFFDETIDYIIDAAAEPSIMAGMNASVNYVINTNLNGTINTLELAARHKAKFIFLSTSRVYPIEHLSNIGYTEGDCRFELMAQQQLKGVSKNGINEDFAMDKARSIYGATKLASELMIEEFREFFDVGSVINRCGVVAGPYQMGKVDQGVITLWVARHFWPSELSYFGYGGYGKQVRDVLHIADLFNLIDYQIHHFDQLNGHIFNVGGGVGSSTSLCELTNICAHVTGNKVKLKRVAETRRGDVPIYITDNSKIMKYTGWQPRRGIIEIVGDIFNWISKSENQLKKILN